MPYKKMVEKLIHTYSPSFSLENNRNTLVTTITSVGRIASIPTTTPFSTDGFRLYEVYAILRNTVFRLNCANYTVQVSRFRVA
jgi:hypothetical protein